MAIDKTGRQIEVGQLVDVTMLGMFTGQVVEIHDAKLTLATSDPSKRQQPYVQLIVPIPIAIANNGMCENLYIVKDAPDPQS